ncbi:MAG: DUF3370 domain-containing protein [Candidatus Sericytochromatia bacterium]
MSKKLFILLLILAFFPSKIEAKIPDFYTYSDIKKKNELDLYGYSYPILPLNGNMNETPVFNSNSPEEVTTEGILLSTFSPNNKSNPSAHLDYKFEGKFDIFSHHLAVKTEENKDKILFQGILLKNDSDEIAKIKVISSSSYITHQAPYIKLDDYLLNDDGNIFSGPGDRVNQDIIRNKNILNVNEITIQPKSHYLLFNEQIPIINGSSRTTRTTFFKLETSKPLYVSDLALFINKNAYDFNNKKPSINEYIYLLKNGNLSQKRDNIPTPLEKIVDKFFYSRVSGVSLGNYLKAKIINKDNFLVLEKENSGIAYSLNSLYNNTHGTNIIQSSKMIRRYNDTSYQAHGNYGVTYDLEIPLYNPTEKTQAISISFNSPKRDPRNSNQDNVKYFVNAENKINFRGEIKVSYYTKSGAYIEKYIHLVQKFGQEAPPLASFVLLPNEKRNVKVKYIYPADCTAPHVLTIYN